tara:strand:+ start:240 stop:623 length:384 start_codon:yes stop_codon:yes gene_type:complete
VAIEIVPEAKTPLLTATLPIDKAPLFTNNKFPTLDPLDPEDNLDTLFAELFKLKLPDPNNRRLSETIFPVKPPVEPSLTLPGEEIVTILDPLVVTGAFIFIFDVELKRILDPELLDVILLLIVKVPL